MRFPVVPVRQVIAISVVTVALGRVAKCEEPRAGAPRLSETGGSRSLGEVDSEPR